MRDRRKCKKSHHLAQIARLATMIGRNWLQLPEAELKQLKNTASRVTPPKGGLSERNRARLQAIDDSGRLNQLLALPEWLCEDACRTERRLGARSVVLARQWQTAVAIEILLRLPLRLKNLADLTIGHSLLLRPDRRVLIMVRASTVKNSVPIETPLPPDSAAMIRTYIEKYRPLLGASGSDFLFPGEKAGTAKSHDALRKQISKTIDERCGLIMNPHLFRHLAAYLILKAHPGNYALVQRVLHHAQLSSTMQHYTGLEGAAAVAFYGELLTERRSARRPSISPTNGLKGRAQ